MIARNSSRLGLVLCLAGVSPSTARAAPPASTPAARSEMTPTNSADPRAAVDEAAGAEPSELEKAEGLFREGVAKYETFDYPGAIELWTRAYATVPRNPGTMSVRTDLVYNLSQAHLKAYEEDGDAVHLSRAQQLLKRYIADYREQHPEGGDGTELPDAQRHLEEVEAKIAAHEAREADPDPAGGDRNVLLLAGIGVAASSVVGFGLMGGGMAMGNKAETDVLAADTLETEADRIDAIKRGQTGNVLGIVGGVLGGALLVGGGALIGIGIARGRTDESAPAGVAGLGGWFGPHGGGVTWRARF